jgi:hypothetical protein
MGNPSLWGPPAWEALFACAWACPKREFHRLVATVDAMLATLPCKKCRRHAVRAKAEATRRLRGANDCPQQMFRWLYLLKDEVNKSLGRPSPPMADITARYMFHSGVPVNDVALGDALVSFAVDAEREGMDVEFSALCKAFADLLPLPADSELRMHVGKVRPSYAVAATLRAARATRIERGFPPLTLAHYKKQQA